MENRLEDLIGIYNDKRLSLAGLETEIRKNMKDKAFWQTAVDRKPWLDSLSVAQAILEHNAKSITVDELAAVVQRQPNSEDFWLTGYQKNPNAKDNNDSREGFTWNHVHTAQGKFFQNVWKKLILKTIDSCHASLVKQYDKDIYEFDDPRLIALKTFFEFYFNKNFEKDANYKHIFMNKILDIILALVREDVYYRARLFDMMRLFVKTYPEGFPMTEGEKANLNQWH